MFVGGKGQTTKVTEVKLAVGWHRNGWLRLTGTETANGVLAEKESERVTFSTPDQKLPCGVEARKTALPYRPSLDFVRVLSSTTFTMRHRNSLSAGYFLRQGEDDVIIARVSFPGVHKFFKVRVKPRRGCVSEIDERFLAILMLHEGARMNENIKNLKAKGSKKEELSQEEAESHRICVSPSFLFV